MASVGDYLIGRLNAWGIDRIYGYLGDGINGIIGALERAEGRMEFAQARHEVGEAAGSVGVPERVVRKRR